MNNKIATLALIASLSFSFGASAITTDNSGCMKTTNWRKLARSFLPKSKQTSCMQTPSTKELRNALRKAFREEVDKTASFAPVVVEKVRNLVKTNR